jgi:hypothetical protein
MPEGTYFLCDLPLGPRTLGRTSYFLILYRKLSANRAFRFFSHIDPFVISGFRCEVEDNCPLLGYYSANKGNFLPTFQDNLAVSSSGVKNLTSEDGIDRLS